MKRSKRQGRHPKGFERGLDLANTDRERLKAAKKAAKANPAGAAVFAREDIPRLMEGARTCALKKYAVDIADPDWQEKVGEVSLGLDFEQQLDLLYIADRYLTLRWCRDQVAALDADKKRTKREREAKVSKAVVEMFEAQSGVLLHNLGEMASYPGLTKPTETFASNVLRVHLSAQLATRISLDINGRLRRALDSVRDPNKRPKRGRYEALLGELYLEAPAVWSKTSATDPLFRDTRKEVIRSIEGCGSVPEAPGTAEAALAEFADRERWLEMARERGLPPREYELLKLVVWEPRRYLDPRRNTLNYPEVIRAMGISSSTARTMWSRINNTLAA